jgi:SEFIR domain
MVEFGDSRIGDRMTEPKVFISYAWTSPEHIEWVVRLATDLRNQSVDTMLDKWDLKEGHDANAFMERMVSDKSVERVIMVCDIAYCQKADARSGGVGTEAQIISPALYTKKEQDKFVAIVREKGPDGRSVVPIFYGSRIHIDMTDDDQYSDNIEKILRWVFEKPLLIKPPIGIRPSYLDQTSEQRTGNSSLRCRQRQWRLRSR